MNNTLTTALAYTIAIPVALGTRLLPVLDTTARYLWSLLVEPEQAPAITAVVPLPVTPVPAVQPVESTPVKARAKRTRTSTASKKTASPKRTSKRTAVLTPSSDGKADATGLNETVALLA